LTIRFITCAVMTVLLAPLAARAEGPPNILTEFDTGVLAEYDAAVVVGYQDYQHLPSVPHASRDAEAFRLYLDKTRGIPAKRIRSLASGGTAPDILAAIEEASATVTSRGVLWVYFSGHGASLDGGRRALVGSRAEPRLESLATHVAYLDEVLAALEASPAKRCIVVLDTGFGGVGRGGEELIEGQRFDVSGRIPADREKITVWSGASRDEASRSYGVGEHGLFTYLVAGALRGWADGEMGDEPDNRITLYEAQEYVARAFVELGVTEQIPNTDRRSEPRSWVLTDALMLESGPDMAGLALIGLDDTGMMTDITIGDEGDDDELEWLLAEEGDRIREEARRKWQSTLELARSGDEAGLVSLEAFIERFENAQVEVDGVVRGVEIPEVHDAHRWLDGYGTGQPTGPDLDTDLEDDPDLTSDYLSAEEARRIGMKRAEYKRYEQSGLTYDEWLDTRFSHARRLHIRVGGAFASGGLDMFYSTRVVMENGLIQENYWWQSIGNRSAAGSFVFGVGYGVTAVTQLGVDFSMVFARQHLLCESRDLGTGDDNIGSSGQLHKDAAHVVIQPRGRFMLLPTKRVKPYLGAGLAMIFMPSFDMPEKWAQERPVTFVLGLEPLVGVQLDTATGIGFFVEVPFAIYAVSNQGYASGHTGEGLLAESELNAVYPPSRVLLRVQAGIQLRLGGRRLAPPATRCRGEPS